jgi:hypothetical protein
MFKKVGDSVACLLVVLVLLLAAVVPVQASISACSASVTPRNATPGTSDLYTITVNNDSSSTVNWVDIGFPPQGFQFSGHYITGWSLSGGVTYLRLSGNTIPAGESRDFVLAMTADVTPVTSTSWTVKTSDDGSGASPTTCGGVLTMSISSSPPQVSNGVTNINVTNITSSSATISWNTAIDTNSIVYYGTTNAYGSHVYSPTQTTNHTMQLTGLSANMGYHFQVGGSNNQNNNAYSTDNTFTTLAQSPTNNNPNNGNSNTGTNNNTNGPAPQPTPARVVQRGTSADEPPQVTLTTTLAAAYKTPPLIQGVATDAVAVAKVEYSTDAGKNWLPADMSQGLGGKSVNFSFMPLLPQDGNYQIVARATDSNGSMALTASRLLVIDRLPPVVGASMFKAGSQQINPAADGLLHAAVGVDQRVVVGAIGGPTSIQLVATSTTNSAITQTFSLARSPDTGLWNGVLAFQLTGTYVLSAKAVDGAHNTTSRKLVTVAVAHPLRVVDAKTSKPIRNARVTIYYLDTETNRWTKWDAQASRQINPARTDNVGNLGLLLPGGTYYLETEADNYRSVITQRFMVEDPSVVSMTVRLKKMPIVNLGFVRFGLPWPSFWRTTVPPPQLGFGSKMSVPKDAPRSLPDFALPLTNGKTLDSSELFGKPTILSFATTWAPASHDQLAVLAEIKDDAINVVPVASGEGLGRLVAYTGIAQYPIPVTVDTNQRLMSQFNVSSVPVTYVYNRHGEIIAVLHGVRSKAELLHYALDQ